MNPDIIVFAAPGADGLSGPPPAPANPDYTGKPAAHGGSCSWGECVCAQNGGNAGSGNRGNTGRGGATPPKAPTLGFIVGRLLSDLVVQTQGGNGGLGGAGSNGSNGGAGQDAGTNVPYCLKAGWISKAPCTLALGGYGGDAGHGGDGGPGGGGGDGGDIYLYYYEAQSIGPSGSVYQIHGLSNPGSVGTGGLKGKAGQPGEGGINEAVKGGPLVRQAGGNPNNDGNAGTNGLTPGEPGNVASHYIPAGSL
jgi:hypothetical protein